MKIVAISDDMDTCTGLRLVGVECHVVKNEDEVAAVLAELQNTGILVLPHKLAATVTVMDFEKANPQIIIATIM